MALRKLAKGADDNRITRRILAIASAHGVDGHADRWTDVHRPTFSRPEQDEIVRVVRVGLSIRFS